MYAYSPYPRKPESLIICRYNYNGTTFSSVILGPWVLVRSGARTPDLPAQQTGALTTELTRRRLFCSSFFPCQWYLHEEVKFSLHFLVKNSFYFSIPWKKYHRPQCYCLSRHVLAEPMHGIIIASIKLSDFRLLSSMDRRLLIKRCDVWSKSEGEIKLTKALSFKRGLRSS